MEPVAESDESYTILHPYLPTDFEELKRSWIQLKEEREDTFEAQCYKSEKRVLELTKLLHKEASMGGLKTRSFILYLNFLLYLLIKLIKSLFLLIYPNLNS